MIIMKKSFLKGFLLILFSSTCFACTNGIENLVDAGTPVVDSPAGLIDDIKASSNLLGWGNIGDTTIRVKADKDVLPALTGKKVDLTAITSNLEGGFRMISVGGSLSAGFRDGGLYREGQLTAFPNLIARQMNIPFYQPLFDANEGNGSGYKTLAGTEPIASFKMVTNNLGYVDGKAEKLKKFSGNNLDSYAFPGMTPWLRISVSDKMGRKFSDRIFNNTQDNFNFNNEQLNNQSPDFFIYETGYDDIIRSIMAGGGGGITGSDPTAETGGTILINNLVNSKAKGVLLNVPDAMDLPYFNQITNDKISKLTGVVIRVQSRIGSENYRDFNPAIDKLIPTLTVEKLMKGDFKGLVPLSIYDVLSKEDGNNEWIAVSPIYYNQSNTQRIAKAKGLPVVDIYTLYKKIFAGTYSTDDGIKVDANWKTGNFFSADGIYPTAFGQAVIANEVIKTINQYYKLTIPLVDTRFFLKK